MFVFESCIDMICNFYGTSQVMNEDVFMKYRYLVHFDINGIITKKKLPDYRLHNYRIGVGIPVKLEASTVV